MNRYLSKSFSIRLRIMSTQNTSSTITLRSLQKFKEREEKFACLTAYDACFSSILSKAGVEVILVGDSLGMVLQGHDSTLPVTMTDMIYHTRCVKRGNKGSLIMADLPFINRKRHTCVRPHGPNPSEC